MTGHGGWPLNVFLTPEQVPFYGGTYFPPEPRHGMPAWTQVLQAIAEAWERAPRGDPRGRRAPARATVRRGAADAVLRAADSQARSKRAVRGLRADASTRATAASAARPKFPQARVSSSCCGARERARDGAAATLRAMARGGIHDQVGGGFARYASTRPGRCRTSRRCSTTTRCSRAPTCTAGRPAARTALLEVCLRHPRLGAARDARPRGRLLLGARRRLRGRRGPLLRVDARASCARCSARTPTRRSPGSAPPSRATSRSAPPGRG